MQPLIISHDAEGYIMETKLAEVRTQEIKKKTIASYKLQQIVKQAIRIVQTSSTLIDHIYVKYPKSI